MKLGRMVVQKPVMGVTKEGDVKVKVVLEMVGDLSEGEVLMRDLIPMIDAEVDVELKPVQLSLPTKDDSTPF